MNTPETVPNTENDGGSKPITMRLNPDELEKAERYARQDRRTRANFLRVMMLRGLAAYEKELQASA